MNYIKQIETGLSTYGKALNFIIKHRFTWFFLFPLLFNILLIAGVLAVVGDISENIQEWLLLKISPEDSELFGSEWFRWFMAGIIWITVRIMFFIIFAYIGGYIVLILMSPVFAYISEKTESILTGRDFRVDVPQLVRDAVRGSLIAIRNLFIEIAFMIILWLTSFIPLIGFMSPIALFLVSSYFYGFSFMDYSNERRGRSIKESIAYIRKHKMVAMANGSLFSLFMLIPVIGPTIAGFAAIVSVVGATLAMNEIAGFESQSKE